MSRDDGIEINRLTAQDTVNDNDLFPIWSGSNQDTRRVTGKGILTYVAANVTASGPMTQYATPAAAATVTIAPVNTGQSVRLLLTPTGTLATLTVTLPGSGGSYTPVDRQEVTVVSTQTITTLTVSAGTTTVIGAPATIAANGSFKMFYDAVNSAWYPA